MLFNFGYPDSASIFESSLTAQIGGDGIDINVTTDDGGTGSTGGAATAPPTSQAGGMNLVTLALIALLIYIAVK